MVTPKPNYGLGSPASERLDSPQPSPESFPKTTKDLVITQRLAQKSAPTPHQSFFGTSAAVYLASLKPSSLEPANESERESHKIALKIIYSFQEENYFVDAKKEIEIHAHICSLPGSKKFIVQYFNCWIEKIDFSSLPDWDADKTLTFHKSLFLTFEYIPCNLIQFRNAHPNGLGLNEVFFLAFQIARGIEFLQYHHIAHRDLKADNILIDEQGRAILSDFGCAVKCQSDMKLPFFTDGVSRGGAPICLPPEIRTLEPGDGVFLDYSKCDTYSLGLLIYVLFGQEPPFNFQTPPPIPGLAGWDVPAEAVGYLLEQDFAQRWDIDQTIQFLTDLMGHPWWR